MSSSIPHRIGRYRVLGPIGRGGLGEVLAAHDERLDRPVAIKRLSADDDVTDEHRKRFETEARLNARLSHPNIVQVYDFVTSDGHGHIVTEYVEGDSLREISRHERPSLARSLEHLCAIAGGLAAAHREGVVHRALRLENILVTRDGQTKIADFGTATLRERVPGGGDGERDDLLDVGRMAYELLSGASATSAPRGLRDVAPDVPAELAALVERLLDRTTNDKPQSARDIETELRSIATRVVDAAVPAKASVQLRQVAVLSLHLPKPQIAIEEIGPRIAAWHGRVNETAARYQAHVMWHATLDPVVCVGYPRVHGDNAAAAANLFTELAGAAIAGSDARLSAGIDLGKVAVVEQPDGPVIVGPAIDGANDAARRAPPGNAYVSHAVQRVLSRSFRLSPVGGETTEGRAAVLYRLEEPLEWEARGAMGASALVGRRDVLARIAEVESLAFTTGGRGSIIVGPPGAGKSRVLRAAIEATRAARIVYLRGTSQTRSIAFAGVERLVRALPELRQSEAGPTRDSIAACVATLPNGSPEMIAAVARILGVPHQSDEDLLARTASYAGHAFVAEQVGRFLVDLLAAHASLLAVEDVFWLDTSSLEVLRNVGRQAASHELFVLCTSRPSPLLRHLPEASFARVELEPLSTEHARQLVDATTIGRVLPTRAAHAIVERSGGLPLVIEELTQLVSARRDGGSGTSEIHDIPTSFADAILERFQDLGAETRRIAQLAATVGNQVDESLLLALAGIPRDELRSHIELLAREGLLHATGFGKQPIFAFRHSLTRDAIYEGQDPTDRAANHRRILERIDAQFPEWETERPDVVALQCEGAGEVERAVRAWLAAGRRAVTTRATAVAAQHFEAALQLLERAEGQQWGPLVELDVRRAYAPVLSDLMNWASKEVNANNARIFELAGDSPTLDWSTTYLGITELQMRGAVDAFSARLGWLDAQFDESSPVAALNRYLLESMRGMMSAFAGYLVRAREEEERALALRETVMPMLRAIPVPEPMLVPRIYLALIAILEGRIDEGWAYQRAEEASHEEGSLAHVTACNFGVPLAMLGHRWEEARWRLELVLKSETVALHHKTIAEYEMAVLRLRDAFQSDDVTTAEIGRHIDTASNALARWRGDPPIIRLGVPQFLMSLAEACVDAARKLRATEPGDYVRLRARKVVDELLAFSDQANILDRATISEAHRLHADLLDLEGKAEAAVRARREALGRARAVEVAPGCRPLLETRLDPEAPPRAI